MKTKMIATSTHVMKLSSIAIVAFLLLAAAGIFWAQDEEARKHLLHDLGGPYIVYRANVQEELKLSDGQRRKLLEKLPDFVDLEAGERGKKMQSSRQKSHEKLWAFLTETMKAEQLERFQQLELQHEGPAAIAGRPEIVKELKITDEQRQQFMGVIQDMQKNMELLMKGVNFGNREEIRLKATKIYEDQEGKIEAILSDAQKTRWKEMRGKPFDVFNDN